MTFVQKLEELQKELKKNGLKITKGQYGIFVEDELTGSFCSIDGKELTSNSLKEISPEKVVCYENN